MRDLSRYDPRDLRVLLSCPVSVVLCLGAAAVTLVERNGLDTEWLVIGYRVLEDRPWLALTTIFPHVGLLHLLFNCYWTWRIGTLLEWIYGPWRMLALVLLIAIPSSLAEYVVFGRGVGLSGVGYGMFGAWWLLDRRNSALRATLDRSTTQVFVIWFFVCIAATLTGAMMVANVAHGIGALAGGLVAAVAADSGGRRLSAVGAYAALLVALAAVVLADSPALHLSPERRAEEYWFAGTAAIELGELPRALELLERSVRWNAGDARAWQNLAYTYQELGRFEEMRAAQAQKERAQLGREAQ